jgi:hypothetical protein
MSTCVAEHTAMHPAQLQYIDALLSCCQLPYQVAGGVKNRPLMARGRRFTRSTTYSIQRVAWRPT